MILFYNHIAFADWRCQQPSKLLIDKLKKNSNYLVVEYPNKMREDDHKRWDIMNQLWDTGEDILMWEASKCPTEQQLEQLANCKELLCSQLYMGCNKYLTNFWEWAPECKCQNKDVMFWFNNQHAHQSPSTNKFCQISDLGLLRFSKKLQRQVPADFPRKTRDGQDFMFDVHIFVQWNTTLIHKHQDSVAYRCQGEHTRLFDAGYSTCNLKADDALTLKWIKEMQ